jgi:hypothetical protein
MQFDADCHKVCPPDSASDALQSVALVAIETANEIKELVSEKTIE